MRLDSFGLVDASSRADDRDAVLLDTVPDHGNFPSGAGREVTPAEYDAAMFPDE